MSCGKMNNDLEHITVLEEAHNLLKRSSSDFSNESGNLTGKSVEMIANAIAGKKNIFAIIPNKNISFIAFGSYFFISIPHSIISS